MHLGRTPAPILCEAPTVRHSSALGHTAPMSPSIEVSAFLQQARGVGWSGDSFPRGCLLLTLPHPFLRLCSFPALQKHCCGFPSGRCRVSYGLILGDCGHLTNITKMKKIGVHMEKGKSTPDSYSFLPDYCLLL